MSQSFRETEGLIVVMNDIITQGNVVIVSFGGSVCDWVINASRMDVSIFYSLIHTDTRVWVIVMGLISLRVSVLVKRRCYGSSL